MIPSHDLYFFLMWFSGFFACDFVGGAAHFIGSLGFEAEDAKTFASWGADYLKCVSSLFTKLDYWNLLH